MDPNHPEPNHHQAAMEFLASHGGSCSVPKDCTLGRAFLDLETVGKVQTSSSSINGNLDVYENPEICDEV